MTDPNDQAFPMIKILSLLSALALGLGAALMLIVPTLMDDPQRARLGVGLMAAVVWLSSLVSVLPVGRAYRLGPIPLIKAYFTGAAVRIIICLLALVAAIKMMDLHPVPVTVTLLIMYLPLLFAETYFVVAHLKKCDFGLALGREAAA